MNRHQVLSGACNAGDHCFAVGSVEGVPFTAYAAGCNIVILASTFERVQIIPGANYNYIRISSIDCSTDNGKIAAAYDNQVIIFEPTPLLQNTFSHQLDYRWVQTATLQADSAISSLSWNIEGTRLLTGGEVLQLWHFYPPPSEDDNKSGVTFEIGEEVCENSPPQGLSGSTEQVSVATWECVWKQRTATATVHMAFSADGTLFATAGRADRLVKIWFEQKPLLFPSRSADGNAPPPHAANEFSYGFVYIAHPRAVTQLSWRRTSKYMPKGSVANMLITSCRDNICRIWVETVLPDDGLVNMSQFDPIAAQNPKFRTHRHKHRFMQRLKHMKTCFHIRRHAKSHNSSPSMSGPIPTLPSTFSVHDFHNYGFQGTGLTTGLHFHLAASINAETDIPLVPSLVTADPDQEPNFILHWLNNKEMHFTLQAENLLHELTKKAVEKEENYDHHDNPSFVDDDGTPAKSQKNKLVKGISQDESNSDEISQGHHHASAHSGGIASHTMSAATSLNSLATETAVPGAVQSGDPLDLRIESLLRDWHHGPDLLFSIHPIDGSFLIWVVEWLDEYHAGSFRQAQVSFSTRIPNAFPLGDAMTMSTNISLFNTCQSLTLRNLMKAPPPRAVPTSAAGVVSAEGLTAVEEQPENAEEDEDGEQGPASASENDATSAAQENQNEQNADGDTSFSDFLNSNPSPVISMVSKHKNGTLNLWQLTFSEKSKFSQVLSISHSSRASGHRFRVNDITCHPVLPLLLTTSHHNIPEVTTPDGENSGFNSPGGGRIKDMSVLSGFCSELILWRVDAVGPLSKSGGVSELARINSPEISAFSNVAWIPTLLPSTTLGNLSNSPSACFVASDGHSLRVYQAVIDARTLLAEINSSERRSRMMDSMISLSTESSMEDGGKHASLHNKIKIVSQQSTARPGCVIQLDAIADATHDWQNTQFLHVFQEQLISGQRGGIGADGPLGPAELGLMEAQLGAMVDLQQAAAFEEPFYIVVLEKSGRRTLVHMWRLVIASQPEHVDFCGSMMYVPDSQLTQEDGDDELDHHVGASHANHEPHKNCPTTEPPLLSEHQQPQASHVIISTTKVCTQVLPLPDDVEVIHAAPAAGHLSSASIYPACFAPYTVVTACSDSTVRFWNCKVNRAKDDSRTYEWCEWEMRRKDHESMIDIAGKPLNISVAYSGRIACAYKYGKSFTRPARKDPNARFVNMCIAIYECESTGGSEWVLEDTIHLKNIYVPNLSEPDTDNCLSGSMFRTPPRTTFDDSTSKIGMSAATSFSTLQTLRKSISERGNVCPLTQKHLVQLDWVSNEDGSHILTVAVGSTVMLFTPVSSDLAQANMKAMKESQSTNRPILRKASSLAAPHFVDEIRWMKLRKIDLNTADGLPALPMQISWVRDGILVIGMDSEMHVYSQWKPSFSIASENTLHHQESEEVHDSRKLKDEQLLSLAQESSQRQLANVRSMTHLTRVSSILGKVDSKKRVGQAEPIASMDYMPDYGLFEASRIACPVLPQYHPKQLMELLNSGKIRWVKAILAHLVRCISNTCSSRQGSVMHASTDEESICKQKGWSRSRALSVSYAAAGGTTSPLEPRGSTTAIPEELMLDYAEITSIPPLPLWTLLAADQETPSASKQANEDSQDYNDLFDANLSMADETLDDILEDEPNSPHRPERRQSVSGDRQGLSHFGPRQGRLLSRLLTHTHLPGLSSLDQMHLLALADTVSTCNTDFAERFAIDAAKTAIAKENLTGVPGEEPSTDSLDDCGLRFLLAMKHFSYLLRCLPLAQRAQFQKQGVGTNNIVWAFHSESEEELLTLIPSYNKGTLRWSTLKELGAGWWMRNYTLLKTCVEKLAKAAYQLKEDPLDAALFYLAMKKKSLVWALFRSKRDERMSSFFSNNFTEDRWRKAALKNAFALLGKQRFEHAAAFFLLAGAIKDAIDVCLSKLEDFQLAMIIARLYEGELDLTPPSLKKLLYEEILGCNAEGEDYNPSKAHPDPFLRSMALWILKDYTGSLNTLLHTNIGSMHPQYIDEDKPESAHANPNVFNFYVYLRTHPLLIRQYIASTAQDKNKGHSVVLSGFSYGSDSKSSKQDKQLLLEDSITPLERQLYFTTAHAHFKAGCPALALEVLSKLPNKVLDSNGGESPNMLSSPTKLRKADSQIDTGQLGWGPSNSMDNKASADDAFDWSQPVKPKEEELTFDWSQPAKRFEDEPLDLGFGKDDDEDEILDSDEDKKKKQPVLSSNSEPAEDELEEKEQTVPLDIMAQQLKFVACLKILMEELSTLATGFEVDGGQLRYQLYMWLEREVEALRQLCNYSAGEADTTASDELLLDESKEMNITTGSFKIGEKPTLHEILMAEKMDFEAKVQRAAKRKKWLKANETLLRTLLSYCSLHGASGGGLASVRMELVLLLQELQQEKTQQQLLSPLPFPTTLPLLSASVACNKTVVADPVRHLQAKTHDMLQTIIELRYPPMPTRIHFSEVFVLRDLSVALSACIYQSLCDSDTFSVKQQQDGFQSAGMETLARLNVVSPSSHLIGGHGRRRRYSSDEPLQVTTHPSKWPGVTNLRALLAREKDEDTPKLNILLCEAFISTYMSLVVYALSTCDCNILYRLVGQNFSNASWASLFGGGVKKLLRVATAPQGQQQSRDSVDKEAPPSTDTAGAMWNAVTSLTKQRVRLNMKLLGQFGSQSGTPPMKEDRPTYREQFVPPEMSMVSYFLVKPQPPVDPDYVDYDSADSAESEAEEEEDVFEGSTVGNERDDRDNIEHSNPNSYSWCVLRLAITTLVQHQLKDFLNIAGIELQELPVSSPLIHAVLRVVYHWVEVLRDDLDSKGAAPNDFIPGCFVDSNTTTGPAIHKYRSLLEKFNTPFHPKQPAAAPARRLWSFLVRQEAVQDIFIRAVFGKRRMMTQILSGDPLVRMDDHMPDPIHHPALPEPVRIIHKDQDSISAFCLNEVSNGLMALATPKEVQEMDISLLLEAPAWFEDECEFDIVNLSKEPEVAPASSFLVIQTASDRPLLAQASPNNAAGGANGYGSSPAPQGGMAGQTGRGASVMKGLNFPGSHNPRFCQFVVDRSRHMLKPLHKHKTDGIRRMSSHPLMPVYLTGSQDGAVQLWEWGHTQAVATPRQPGTFAKVTRVRFSQHGNKFGVADGDGNVSLWQVGVASTVTRPFFSYQCHNKLASDFVFLGSCSLLATAGHSSESKNVALWDSLLPQKKALVTAFACHEQGASSIVFAPQHQAIISAGKKGDICIFDVRQRQLRQRFQGHESAVKCLALDPNEEFFVTGSADGDIKVWSMTTLQPYFMFPGEHARSSFFKNIGQGVTQLHIDSGSRLFSCGADGSMKVRQLPERDLVVNSVY